MTSLSELLGPVLRQDFGKALLDTNAQDNVESVGQYFSALWCPPCKMFNPKIINVYKEINEKAKKLELIYISGDQSEEDYNECIKSQPFLAIQYDEDAAQQIFERYSINSIPSLIIIEKNTKVLIANGRERVTKEGANFMNKK